jgi:purine-binding chemotaxis protein CheW
MSTAGEAVRLLLCRVGTRLCGIPLEHTLETMRPLPLEQMADMPRGLLGLSLIRGGATPVLDANSLLLGSERSASPERFVTLRVGARKVALAVDVVVGVRRFEAGLWSELSPLLGEANRDLVSRIGTLDSELLFVLESGRIVPESLWSSLELQGIAT